MPPSGRFHRSVVAGEAIQAFVPEPLPPAGIELSSHYAQLDKANQALGRLEGLSLLLPNASLFLYLYVQKEALLSSQIEGTQSSLADLIMFENAQPSGAPIDDVEEVSNYVAAVNHGLRRIEEGFPLSLRLLREIHAILLRGGRGANAQPGEFRRSQNWIGGTRPGNAIYVPPPTQELASTLDAFERFLHDDTHSLPRLVKIALAHVQFETIHPFLDGNGRLGRLLITLMLCSDGALSRPLLYLSLFFKTHRATYYDLLQAVRLNGAWNEWIGFFLEGVHEVANQAADAARRILGLFAEDRARLQSLGRRASAAMRVHDHFQRRPISHIRAAVDETGLSFVTVAGAIDEMVRLEILREITGKARARVFVYSAYMATLSEGADPLPI
ncbi:MAG TPA: Fic family protein [Caulobacteraceae bacterium]